VWLDVVGSINTVADVFVKSWFIMMVFTGIKLSVRHIEVIVVDWLVMALFKLPVLVFMTSWVNCLEHIVVRVLNEVRVVVMNWLRKDSLMVSIWVVEGFMLVVHWLLEMEFLIMVVIGNVVMLNWRYDVDEMEFSSIPNIWVLVSLVLSLWDVVMVRDPVVLRGVLFFWGLGHWVNPHVFIEMMHCWLEVLSVMSIILNMCWDVHVMVLGSDVSVFFILISMASCVSVVILVISVLLLHALVMMELVLEQLGVLNEIVVDELVALCGVKGVDHVLLEDK